MLPKAVITKFIVIQRRPSLLALHIMNGLPKAFAWRGGGRSPGANGTECELQNRLTLMLHALKVCQRTLRPVTSETSPCWRTPLTSS